MTERKTFTIRPEFKADEEGLLLARFATLNVVDKDGDVTLPGAFGEQAVRMQPYGHDTASPSIGKGSIHEEADEAIAEMRINLKMQAGREVYESLKFDAADGKPLQEFSYTFDVGKWSHGQFEGHDVRFLESLRVHSVDPVFLGANWVVFRVLERQDANPSDLPAQRQEITQQMIQSRRQVAYEAFRTSLENRLKAEGRLEYNEANLRRLTNSRL